MSKMSLHAPFGYLKHKLWPKKGSGVKLAVWLPTIKSHESPWFTYVQVAYHIPLESSWQGLQLCFRPHSFEGLQEKLSAPKLWESQFWEFRNSNLGVRGQNDIWVLALWPSTKNTIRGKVMAFPKFGPWWVLWVRVCPRLIRALKVLQLCTNQLIVWFV
jgi:hypothetical protein